MIPVVIAKPPVRGSLRPRRGPEPPGLPRRGTVGRPILAAVPCLGILTAVKWVGVAVLVIIGVLAAIAAIEYFAVAIHSLPSFFPGYRARVPGHPAIGTGHYHKGGAAAALIAVVCIAAAVVLSIRFTRESSAPAAPASAGDLLSGSGSPPAAPPAG